MSAIRQSLRQALLALAVVSGSLLALAPAQATTPEPGVVVGTVVGPDGSPMAEGRIVAYRPAWEGAWTEAASTRPDAEGRYRLDVRPAGEYWLRFVPADRGWAPEFYPDAATIEAAQPLSLRDEPTSIDVELAAQSTSVTLRGTVTRESGAPLSDARVRLHQRVGLGTNAEFELHSEVSTDGDGHYTAMVEPGSWVVEFDVPERPWFMGEYHRDKATLIAADPLELVDGETRTVDAELACNACPPPTSEPTTAPTSEPTTVPTSEPTAPPTSEPTGGPVLLDPTVRVGALSLWGSAVFTVGVSARGALPTGDVTVRLGDKTVAKARLLLGATILFAGKLPRGEHGFTITYAGDPKVAATSVTKVLRIS